MATEPLPPEFACDECGAHTIEIPEWTDSLAVLSCQECGKPIATIGRIVEVLQAASVDNENQAQVHPPQVWCKTEKARPRVSETGPVSEETPKEGSPLRGQGDRRRG